MRAISIRPLTARRNSTSLTLSSNVAAGSYAVFIAGPPAALRAERGHSIATAGTPAAPSAVIVLRKSRRPGRFMLPSPSDGPGRIAHPLPAGIAHVPTALFHVRGERAGFHELPTVQGGGRDQLRDAGAEAREIVESRTGIAAAAEADAPRSWRQASARTCAEGRDVPDDSGRARQMPAWRG